MIRDATFSSARWRISRDYSRSMKISVCRTTPIARAAPSRNKCVVGISSSQIAECWRNGWGVGFDYSPNTNHYSLLQPRGCSSMAERQLPKLHTGVRFPSPAPAFASRTARSRLERPPKPWRRWTPQLKATAGKPAMFYVYLLRSQIDAKQEYVGLTLDLRKRVQDHNAGRSAHTSKFCPWSLVAYFGFANKRHATAFERYLKSGSGRAFIKRHFR